MIIAHHTLCFQIRFIAYHQHRKLISIFYTQYLSMELEDFLETRVICYTKHKYESYKKCNAEYVIFRLDSNCSIDLPSPDRIYCSRIAENSSCPAVSIQLPKGNHELNHSIINYLFNVLTQDIKFRWNVVNHNLLQ